MWGLTITGQSGVIDGWLVASLGAVGKRLVERLLTLGCKLFDGCYCVQAVGHPSAFVEVAVLWSSNRVVPLSLHYQLY